MTVDPFLAARLARRQKTRDELANIIEAARAYHKRPDSEDLKLWLLEEFYTFLGADDLYAEIEDLRHQLGGCEDCHRINCICDVRFEDGGYHVEY